MGLDRAIRIGDQDFELFISSEEIRDKVCALAEKIDHWYHIQGVHPQALVIMDGAFVFASDLLRQMELELSPLFLKISSYKGLQQQEVKLDLSHSGKYLANRPVLIIEDILDSGNSMWKLLENLKSHSVQDIRICSLLSKPDILRKEIKPDWVGFEIPPDFVIGYGLDCDGMGRGLQSIYRLRT